MSKKGKENDGAEKQLPMYYGTADIDELSRRANDLGEVVAPTRLGKGTKHIYATMRQMLFGQPDSPQSKGEEDESS